MVDSTHFSKVYRTDGGDAMKVASGGHIDVESGGELRIGGTAITATAAEINAAAGTGVSSTELDLLDGALAGTAVASKALALGATKNVDTLVIADGGLYLGAGAGTSVSATAAELNYNDIAALGTGAASKAVVLSSTGTYVGPTAATTKFTWSVTSDSTDGGTSVEPFVHNTTMTGIGGVGGRARFELDTNVALGSWSNALKAQAQYGAAGKTTGLGSAFVAELILSAGTVDGTYAPLEIELGVPSGASTGTATSFIYMSVNDTPAAFDTAGYLFNIQGLTQNTNKVLKTGLTQAVTAAASIRVKIGATDYFIPLCAVQALTS